MSSRSSTGRRGGPIVSVYGSSMVPAGHPHYTSALRLGELLARAGASVACGGYGGVMEGVSRGAVESGAHAIGYTVQGWNTRVPNPYLSEETKCRSLYERLRRLIEDSDALVALGGGIGTLAEVMLAWQTLSLNLIPERPLILVGSEWARAMEALSGLLDIGQPHLDLITLCGTVDEVVDCLHSKRIFA